MEAKMIILLLIFATSTFPEVAADLVAKPRDTEAMIGDSTYFDCASDVNTNEVLWYHYAVGARDHEDVCVYCLGRIHPRYENRIEVERNVSNGNFRLRLKSLQQKDSGRYVCQDNGGIGEAASAQLVILESNPICSSNIKSDGVLGPSDCGLEPDTLHFSCQVSYHGNILPVVKWRKDRTNDPVDPSSCQNEGHRMTCDLTLAVDLPLEGVSYICETSRSTTTQYNCVSEVVRVMYVKMNNSTEEVAEGAEERVHCSVNSSLSCSQTWKWFDGVHEELVAYGSELVARKPGWHKCEAECIIRKKRCIVLSKLVHVSERKGPSLSLVIAATCIAIIAVELFIVGLVYKCFIKSKLNPYFKKSQNIPLLRDKNLPIDYEQQPSMGSVLMTKKVKEQGKLIRGMTILDNELYLVYQKCSEVEVFYGDTLNSARKFTLKELIRPSDIASCKENKCLYIMDWKEDLSRKEIICFDPKGTILRHWATGNDYGDLISVTDEMTITMLACYGKNEFCEYSPEGIFLRKIALQDIEIPSHVIKLQNNDFVVTNGDASHLLHRVCIVDGDGRVKQSFGREKGSHLDHLDHPLHLAVFADGSIAVLDNGNRRVLLLDENLQFNGVLLSNRMHGLQNPTRLLLDESNYRLFVADSHNGTGVIIVFQLSKDL